MQSIHNIVAEINLALQKLIDCELSTEHAEFSGVAVSVGKEKEILPATLNRSGEGVYVGIDDLFAVRGYHKVNNMVCSLTPTAGRIQGDHKNTYSLSLIVFLNRKRSMFLPDEIVQLIQAYFPDTMKMDPYSNIKISFTSVILNDLQVYNQEYRTETLRLLPEHNLFQLNYSVEMIFKKDCFKNVECTYY